VSILLIFFFLIRKTYSAYLTTRTWTMDMNMVDFSFLTNLWQLWTQNVF
jgi:hypothetical protein